MSLFDLPLAPYPARNDWDTEYTRYSGFMNKFSLSHYDRLIPFDATDCYAIVPNSGNLQFYPSSFTDDITVLLEKELPYSNRKLIVHLPVFVSKKSKLGHSILIEFNPETMIQTIMDPIATFDDIRYATDSVKQLYEEPLVSGYSVERILAPHVKYTLQSKAETVSGFRNMCGLLCILVAVLVAKERVSMSAVVQQVSKTCDYFPHKASVVLKQFASFYMAATV